MPQINFGEEQNPTIETATIQEPSVEINHQQQEQQPADDSLMPPSDKIMGLSKIEMNDPNRIEIEISDKQAPIIVLFGQPACGKTMTLVRMTRYLTAHGYSVEPVNEFRPNYDANYAEICENFNAMMNDSDAAKTTSKISFMLVKVSKNGKTICQILEAPGEYYFNPLAPNAKFPKYFSAITSSPNRKLWCLFVEPKWGNLSDRKNYVSKIEYLKKKIKGSDSIVFVYNKIDDTNFLMDGDGHVKISEAKKDINDRYPGIFDKFKETTPIKRWFSPYKFEFVPFQTGDYPKAADGTKGFEQGPDVFPRRLWNVILKKARG
ncbi:MAG: hypothetical protein IJ838_02045 [Paludibacteraceae bacterium]|nr:hypothetical protein [Paludibacteraceae bacterium]